MARPVPFQNVAFSGRQSVSTLALDAILGRDYPTLLGVLTFSSILVIVANLLTDMSYRWIDPRLRGK